MVIVKPVTQEAKKAAHEECQRTCSDPLKCQKNGLIFVENCFFPCPDYQLHKQTRGLQKRLNQSIPQALQEAELENYQCQNDSQFEVIATAKRYFKKKAWQKGKGMIISGLQGLGKSHIVVAMYKQLMQKGISTVFSRPKTMGDYKSIEKYYQQLEKPKVLIYDDMGPELRKDFILDLLFILLDKRLSSNKGVIITTNIPTNALKNTLGPRIHSRLAEKNFFLEVKGGDYRQLKRELY